ncbi:MAG: AEC family transporter [Agathobacter sp.]
MNVQVVFQQMLVIVALVCLGMWMYKKNYISDEMTGKLSSIVVDVCNPMLCISCGLSAGEAASRRNIAMGMLLGILMYLLTIILGFLIPKLCRIKRDQQKFYNMMLVYANTGFIGIPVAKAILPAEAMVIFWFHLSLPQMAADCIAYIGNATTFLSMSLLGCSFAVTSIHDLFSNRDLYLFSVIKMLLILLTTMLTPVTLTIVTYIISKM